MTRAVLDANVVITAVLTPSGPGAAVLEAWRSERFALLVSPPILGEIARVLAYPKIARRHRWSKKEIMAFVRDLGDLAIVTPGQLRLSVIREDPDDDRYVECAVATRVPSRLTGSTFALDPSPTLPDFYGDTFAEQRRRYRGSRLGGREKRRRPAVPTRGCRCRLHAARGRRQHPAGKLIR